MTAMLAGVLIMLAGAIAQFFAPERRRPAVAAVFAGAGAIPVLFASVTVMITGAEARAVISGRALAMDGLSAFFAVIIAVMSFVAALYSVPYMKMYEGKGMGTASHYFFLPVLAVSMLCVTIARDPLAFLISWEIMTLSSFFLVIFESVKKQVLDAGIYYLVMSHIGVALLMAGFSAAGWTSGNFDAMAVKVNAAPVPALLVFGLLSAGFAVKAGIIPMHTWLPAAHPAAPTHVSALMSGVMIKMGVYGIARCIMLFPDAAGKASYVLLALGLLTALLGAFYSMAQKDMKRALAYSSIENAGIIVAGLGLGLVGIGTGKPYLAMLGFAGAFMHVFNHSILKMMLFMAAGSVYIKTHTRDMEHLGGLAKGMPVTAMSFLAGSAGISGLPLLNGFGGEFIIYLAMIEAAKTGAALTGAAGVLSLAALGFAGAMAVLSFTRMYGTVFSGLPRSEKAEAGKDEDPLIKVVLASLAALSLAAGIIPQAVFWPAFAAAKGLAGADPGQAPAILGKLSVVFISIAAASVLLLVLRAGLLKKKTGAAGTWACGYDEVSPKMQYTAFSYAEQFLKLGGPLAGTKTEEKGPEGLFPDEVSARTGYHDAAEKKLVQPAAAAAEKALRMFSWIQSGNMQRYIIYAIIFLLLSLAWVLGGVK